MTSGAEDLQKRCANCGCCPTCGKPNNWPYYGLQYIPYPYVPVGVPIWIAPMTWPTTTTGFLNVGTNGSYFYNYQQGESELCSQ